MLMVLLAGLGADEQCVGYKGRHRTRFARCGVRCVLSGGRFD
jgi:asparagine synthetase B (glutamine-hydrolysing)